MTRASQSSSSLGNGSEQSDEGDRVPIPPILAFLLFGGAAIAVSGRKRSSRLQKPPSVQGELPKNDSDGSPDMFVDRITTLRVLRPQGCRSGRDPLCNQRPFVRRARGSAKPVPPRLTGPPVSLIRDWAPPCRAPARRRKWSQGTHRAGHGGRARSAGARGPTSWPIARLAALIWAWARALPHLAPARL